MSERVQSIPTSTHYSRPFVRFLTSECEYRTGCAVSSGTLRTGLRIKDWQVTTDVADVPLVALPGNYNFEIHKTIHHIRRDGVQTVALQMPEGLMVYGCAIADIVERWVTVQTVTSCLAEMLLYHADETQICMLMLMLTYGSGLPGRSRCCWPM